MPKPRQPPIGLHLTRSARRIERAFNASLTEAGGSTPIWTILLALRSGSARNQREIAERVGIRGATLTHHLNAMEGAGLVIRRRDPTNRRVHLVGLTADGEDAFDTLRRTAGDFDRRLRDGIDPDELATFERVLARLADNVSAA